MRGAVGIAKPCLLPSVSYGKFLYSLSLSTFSAGPEPSFVATHPGLSPTITDAWFIKWFSGERRSWLLANIVLFMGKSHMVRFTSSVSVKGCLESK